MKKIFFMVVILILALPLSALAAPPQNGQEKPAKNGQETCPDDGNWVKVDGLSGLTYTFPVPDGYTVGENCYKAGNEVVRGSGPTITSTVWNKDGCPEANGCNYQELSHGSFELIPDPTEDEYVYVEDSDCDGWSLIRVYDSGAEEVVESGQWSDPDTLESVRLTGSDYDVTIHEPEECLQEGEPNPTPTPTREREDPPAPPKTGGGWEIFLIGAGILAGVPLFAIRRRGK